MIKIDIPKAQLITKDRLRAERTPLLQALDIEMMKNLSDTAKLAEIEAEKQRLREIQPLIKRAEQLGYQNIDSLKNKTKKEITDIMTIWLAQQEAEKGE